MLLELCLQLFQSFIVPFLLDILQHKRHQQKVILHVHNTQGWFGRKVLVINRKFLGERKVKAIKSEGVKTDVAP